MKRLLIAVLLLMGLAAQAQYNNEWIDFNKTYFKFKVGNSGIYRINRASLQSIGLGNESAENFQLWRNGEQVAIYTSVPSGQLGGSDYIEFWGARNDGKADTKLYRDPNLQLSSYWSLLTDTAAYFLTVNSTSPNFRVSNDANNVAGNALPPEPYFMYTLPAHFHFQINPG